MFKIKVKVDKKSLDKATDTKWIDRGVLSSMKKVALFAEGEAKKNFGGPNQLHVRTGNLRRSIIGEAKNNIASIGTDVIYGRIHELGGPIKGGYMPERPYLQPAFDKNEDKIDKIIETEMIRAWEKQ